YEGVDLRERRARARAPDEELDRKHRDRDRGEKEDQTNRVLARRLERGERRDRDHRPAAADDREHGHGGEPEVALGAVEPPEELHIHVHRENTLHQSATSVQTPRRVKLCTRIALSLLAATFVWFLVAEKSALAAAPLCDA